MKDLRTKAGREEEIINYVRDHGGFGVFWAIENQKRACAVDRLISSGVIKETFPRGQFPFNTYEIKQLESQ